MVEWLNFEEESEEGKMKEHVFSRHTKKILCLAILP